MAGTGQSGVQVDRRKPVIQGGPVGETLSAPRGAGYGRQREYEIAPGSCPSMRELGRPRSGIRAVRELELAARCGRSSCWRIADC